MLRLSWKPPTTGSNALTCTRPHLRRGHLGSLTVGARSPAVYAHKHIPLKALGLRRSLGAVRHVAPRAWRRGVSVGCSGSSGRSSGSRLSSGGSSRGGSGSAGCDGSRLSSFFTAAVEAPTEHQEGCSGGGRGSGGPAAAAPDAPGAAAAAGLNTKAYGTALRPSSLVQGKCCPDPLPPHSGEKRALGSCSDNPLGDGGGGPSGSGSSRGGGSDGGCGGGDGSGGAAVAWPPRSERLGAVAERLLRQPRVEHPPVSSRSAAVLVGLFADRLGVVRVLLTQRSAKLKSHRGEVCLPGGKRDEGDEDDAATALREAHEELGLDPHSIRVLGALPPVLSKHHLSVTPVLALLLPDAVPRPNPHEVAAAFTVPLAVFLGQLSDPRVTDAGLSDPRVSGGGAPATAAVAAAAESVASDGAGAGGAGIISEPGRRTRRRTAEATAAAAPPPPGPETQQQVQAVPISWLPEGTDAGTGGAAAAPRRRRDAGPSLAAMPAPVPSVQDDCSYPHVEHEYRDIPWDEHMYRIHYFQYGEFNVWGLTATICIAAAQLALGREPAFEERCPGGHHYSCFHWDGSALRIRPSGGSGSGSGGALRNTPPSTESTEEVEADGTAAVTAAAAAATTAAAAAVTVSGPFTTDVVATGSRL